ncbi:MAG TPA: NUDIX domain-containing protein [Kofleriaceae bacterium]|nr:NUDIX domain-containing protein [Kofleriaceae bacterium]
MHRILDNQRFADAFRQLAGVTLNPRRHTAPSALEHSEAVSARAAALASANGCTAREARLLEDLGLAHDIGKVTGTAHPERSLEVLRACGVTDPELLALVKWHDTSLPWYRAMTRGQPPSDRAWRRLAAELDLRLLALFMVADRVDAPPGWRRNAPTVWFLAAARERGLLGDLALDLPDQPSEVSAGGALVRAQGGARELLVLRVRAGGYELPKGGIEWDELPAEAAVREAREEAGIESALTAGDELGHLDYPVEGGGGRHLKRVRYFALAASGPIELRPLSGGVRERRWIRREEVAGLPLVSEALRPLMIAALAAPHGSGNWM